MLYRIETAKEDLNSAKILRDANSYKGANNRAYYAVFHAINAIHALSGVAYKRHKDAIANFNKEYVKTNIFPREMGRNIATNNLNRLKVSDIKKILEIIICLGGGS